MAWREQRKAELTAHEGVSDLEIYEVLTLALISNRSVPDYIDDDEVSAHLRRVIQTHRHLIPFRVPWLKEQT
jgi:hypothetical protein